MNARFADIAPVGRISLYRLAMAHWLLGGLFGAHRFYLGLYLSAGLQCAAMLFCLLVMTHWPWVMAGPVAWWLMDIRILGRYGRHPAAQEADRMPDEILMSLDEFAGQYRVAVHARDPVLAASSCREALALLEESNLKETLAAMRWHARLGESLRLQGESREAVAILNRAVGALERLRDEEGLCECLPWLAQAWIDAGMPLEAEPVFRRLVILQSQVGISRRPRLETRLLLADLYVDNHHPQEALPIYRDIAGAVNGVPELCRYRASLGEGFALLALELLDDAGEVFRQVLAQTEEASGRAALAEADCRRGLGLICLRRNDLGGADRELTAALDVRERLAPVHFQESAPFSIAADEREEDLTDLRATAAILKDLVRVCLLEHRSTRAMGLAERRLQLVERIHGTAHPRAERARARLAVLRARVGPALSNARLLQRLHTWDTRYGLEICSAEAAEMTFRLHEPPTDMAGFYRELREICPGFACAVSDANALASLLENPDGVIRLVWDSDQTVRRSA